MNKIIHRFYIRDNKVEPIITEKVALPYEFVRKLKYDNISLYGMTIILENKVIVGIEYIPIRGIKE